MESNESESRRKNQSSVVLGRSLATSRTKLQKLCLRLPLDFRTFFAQLFVNL